MQPILKKLPPALRDMQERRILHRLWNAWLVQVSESEWSQFNALRFAFAPKQPCSGTRLIRACQGDPYLASQLPQSLRERLREASLLAV